MQENNLLPTPQEATTLGGEGSPAPITQQDISEVYQSVMQSLLSSVSQNEDLTSSFHKIFTIAVSPQLFDGDDVKSLPNTPTQCLQLHIPEGGSQPNIPAMINELRTPSRVENGDQATFAKFDSFPAVLALHVMRYRFAQQLGSKITTRVIAPFQLELEDFPDKYSLHASLNHVGDSCNNGHYIAVVHGKDQVWRRFDDTKVSVLSDEDACQLIEDGFMLIYVKD
uniref:USP domain-containing protein n=1 Tax=Spongospora subterranea TaxID=70186 RepID=A0A0H5R7U5_9EUKA|eukprot:CRZ04354.1 hypothetical protein [Spongospora subterranea]